MTGFKLPPKEENIACVLDLSQPIAERMRAVFYLRTQGGEDAEKALATALRNKEGTTLFRHEVAYVLGQMVSKVAATDLLEVLKDTSDDPIVRHEAAEALGAIGGDDVLEILLQFTNDERPEVAETCQIAADRIKWMKQFGDTEEAITASNVSENPYESIDPAPAAKKPKDEDVPYYAARLMDTSLSLFERYQAMFALRNNGSEEAVLALCKGLEASSALFRHEVAFVLGQLQHPAAISALKASVLKDGEHEMVRHEAAEALGAIGTGECVDFLKEHAKSEVEILRESCEVALDVVDYWAEGESKEAEATA